MASERPSYIEYVVALLEKALSPTSIVKQNVWLPVLARPDERRQCDVVIENQSGPRATFELVEVQARKRKLGSHDFQAFVDKARELGATRLICVSTAGFTGPIFNRARTLGYFVSLVHLNSWDIGVWPEQFAFKHFDITTRKVTAIKNYGFYCLHDDHAIKLQEQLGDRRISELAAVQLMCNFVNEPLPALDVLFKIVNQFTGAEQPTTPGTHDVSIGIDGTSASLVLIYDNNAYPLKGINVDYQVTISLSELPVKGWCYETIQVGQMLGWLIRARGSLDGRAIEIACPIVHLKGGGYKVGPIVASGLNTGQTMMTIRYIDPMTRAEIAETIEVEFVYADKPKH